MVLVFTEEGELNSLCEAKGVFWQSLEGGPSNLIRGVRSCDSGLIVWTLGGGVTAGGGRGRG